AIVCRDEDAARRRFGVVDEGSGICLTRTGRRFFDDSSLEHAFLAGVRAALDRAGFWEEFATEWVCLDCELMPWSAKAQGLLTGQYAPVGTAARAALQEADHALAQAAARGIDVGSLQEQTTERLAMAERHVAAYPSYS